MNDTDLTRRSCGGWNGILYVYWNCLRFL